MKATEQIEVRAESTEFDQSTGAPIPGDLLLSGEVVYNTYPYPERIKKYQEIMLGVDTNAETSTVKDDLLLTGRYFEVVKERVVSLNCKLADGTEINSVDHLYEYSEGITLGNSIALKLVSGQRLGKIKLE